MLSHFLLSHLFPLVFDTRLFQSDPSSLRKGTEPRTIKDKLRVKCVHAFANGGLAWKDAP